MQSAAAQFEQQERLLARLAELNAEKARIDGDIAVAAAELRVLYEDRLSLPAHSGNHHTNLADTTTASEIACLLRISERSAHRLVQQSRILVDYHPRTLAALRSGALSWGHAAALVHEYAGLPAGTAELVETRLLPLALETTVTRLSYRARKLRSELHPTALDQRARDAAGRRRVDFQPADDAMAWLSIFLPAADAIAVDARLTAEARGLQDPSERRTLSQLRTDVALDLLLGSRNEGGSASQGERRVKAHINVTVPVLTLLGVDDEPADLEGYGPIPAEVARRLAAHAPSFTRLLTHPESGAVLSVGRTTYAVPADLKKWLRVRDRTCRHPGCCVPASRCELDHTKPWSRDGTTDHDNLAHLCRKHHLLKSEGIWRYSRSETNTLLARSPGGRTYRCE